VQGVNEGVEAPGFFRVDAASELLVVGEGGGDETKQGLEHEGRRLPCPASLAEGSCGELDTLGEGAVELVESKGVAEELEEDDARGDASQQPEATAVGSFSVVLDEEYVTPPRLGAEVSVERDFSEGLKPQRKGLFGQVVVAVTRHHERLPRGQAEALAEGTTERARTASAKRSPRSL
jgi:hypothetical protein